MAYTVGITPTFIHDLNHAPRKVQNTFKRDAQKRVETQANRGGTDANIKKLRGWKELYRYRIGDYRVVYSKKTKQKEIRLLLLGKRSTVYGRIGHSDEGPVAHIIADESTQELIEIAPGPMQLAQAMVEAHRTDKTPRPTGETDNDLPARITADQLNQWDIGERWHSAFLGVRTEGEFLELENQNVPVREIEKVLYGLYPPTIAEVIQEPVRVVPDETVTEELLEDTISLESLLLMLDEDQKPFVNRFEGPKPPTGPWLLKGGPGSGKSTIALYCLKSLAEPKPQLFGTKKPRILFTTYTKALITSTNTLLTELGVDRSQVDVLNIDKLAWRVAPESLHRRRALKGSAERGHLAKRALGRCLAYDSKFAFDASETDFLFDEIEWVLLGQNCQNSDDYVAASRKGRPRRLSGRMKRHMWRFWMEFKKEMDREDLCLFVEFQVAALKAAKPTYDYVFIDEVQDLKPVGIQLCVKLAKSPQNVLISGDSNQSIYGPGMSWVEATGGALNFSGRSKILRKNYRSTREIWSALLPVAKAMSEPDKSTLESEVVRSGRAPILCGSASIQEEADAISEFILSALIRHRMSLSCAAVVCEHVEHGSQLAKLLNRKLKAKWMRSSDFTMQHNGVKVTTIAAAKGLQFPIVVVAGMAQNFAPSAPKFMRTDEGKGIDESEDDKARKLFFVACTRAMYSLMVCAPNRNCAQVINDLDLDDWDDWE